MLFGYISFKLELHDVYIPAWEVLEYLFLIFLSLFYFMILYMCTVYKLSYYTINRGWIVVNILPDTHRYKYDEIASQAYTKTPFEIMKADEK